MQQQDQQIARIDKRLARVEQLLKEALERIAQEPAKKRMTEKEVIAEYDVSKNVLRKLRLGYKRSDGMDIPPMLFKWGHRLGRNFDYDVDELNNVLRKKAI